jgi:hypothetical protein
MFRFERRLRRLKSQIARLGRQGSSLDAQPPMSRFPGGNNLMLVHT